MTRYTPGLSGMAKPREVKEAGPRREDVSGPAGSNDHAGAIGYAGTRSFYRLRDTVAEILGFHHVLPTHQGRGAENILFTVLVRPGQHVIGNMHFDTTRAHIEHKRGIADDLVVEAMHDPIARIPFKGDLDLQQAEALAAGVGRDQIALGGRDRMRDVRPCRWMHVQREKRWVGQHRWLRGVTRPSTLSGSRATWRTI